MSIFVPAVNAACAFASVYCVTVDDIALFPSIEIPVPAVYSVLVSVEDITPFVMSIFVPAVNAACAFASVY